MAIAGHVSREMLEHYSHIRMDAKRVALDAIATPLPEPKLGTAEAQPERERPIPEPDKDPRPPKQQVDLDRDLNRQKKLYEYIVSADYKKHLDQILSSARSSVSEGGA